MVVEWGGIIYYCPGHFGFDMTILEVIWSFCLGQTVALLCESISDCLGREEKLSKEK